jgi:predicted O-methyltransferase YrrM
MRVEEQNLLKQVQQVEGWLSDKEAVLLYNLAQQCTGKGVIVEIGSWKGKSTICLAKGSKSSKQVKIYAVDPHTGMGGLYGEDIHTFDQFKENIETAGVSDIIVPLVTTSENAVEMIKEPIELIFIDGGHDYADVKRDFELWFPRIMDGGTMAFHDAVWQAHKGPSRLVKERVYGTKYFRDVSFPKRGATIVYATKVKNNTLFDRLRGTSAFVAKTVLENVFRMLHEVRVALTSGR